MQTLVELISRVFFSKEKEVSTSHLSFPDGTELILDPHTRGVRIKDPKAGVVLEGRRGGEEGSEKPVRR